MNDFISAIEAQEANNPYFINMSFNDRIDNIVDSMYQIRSNERIKRLIKQSHIRYFDACIEDVNFSARHLDKGKIQELATCQYILAADNIAIVGPTSSGKTYLSCALAKSACMKNIKTLTIKLLDLLEKYYEECTIGRGNKFINKIVSMPLLIIDEWLIFSLSDQDIKFIYQVIELRYKKTSTIFVSQYRKTEWHERLGGGTHADAIMDRIEYKTIIIECSDANMRTIYDKTSINIG